jgi:hypothetical protein
MVKKARSSLVRTAWVEGKQHPKQATGAQAKVRGGGERDHKWFSRWEQLGGVGVSATSVTSATLD